jgi:hypothetical protein
MIEGWSEEKFAKHTELVRRGKLTHILHAKQREVIKFMKDNPKVQDIAIYSSRRFGKSFMLCVYGIEHCLQNPTAVVRHCLPSLKNAKDVCVPLMDELMKYIPDELRPIYYASTGTYKFHNGATYILCGAHRDSLDGSRGNRCTLLMFDECAFFDSGSYSFAMDSVFLPQQTLVKNPVRLYATTPAVSPDHPFVKITMPLIQATGAWFHYTIYDSPLITPERIEEIKNRLGENSSAWRREYMAELIADASLRVTPEFNRASHVTNLLPETEDAFGKKTRYVGYLIGDFGVGNQDLTAILAAIFDHDKQQIIVVGEKLLFKPTADTFVDAWNEMKAEHLAECSEIKARLDAFESLKHTLRVQYSLQFNNPQKGKITDNVAFLRSCLENNKLLVHESCVNFIQQLELGIWDDNHKEFSRSDSLGHLDLVAAGVYLARAVDFRLRPGQSSNNIKLGMASPTPTKAKYNESRKVFKALR